MTKLTLVFPLLMMLDCGNVPVTTTGTPTVPQGPTACNGTNFPSNKPSSSSCCQEGSSLTGEIWHVIGTGDNGLAHRYLGKACTANFGPCGAAKDPLEDPQWINGTGTKIFRPASANRCGYQVKNSSGVTTNFPEPYNSQTLYPGVTASCAFTACVGKTPVVKVYASMFNRPVALGGISLGRVVSNPPGLTLSGTGEASGLFPGDVTLIAEPTGKHVRAVFSGDCIKAGEYGDRAECVVKLAPDPKINVTFECEKGFTCGTR
jgi:hypothetical protein